MKSALLIIGFVAIQVLDLSAVSGSGADYNRYSYDRPSTKQLYSYYTKLEASQPDGSVAVCSGALLTNRWIITSCEWLNDAVNVTAVLGNAATDRHSLVVEKNKIVHATNGEYQDSALVQLIELPILIKYTEAIQRIDLPNDCALSSGDEIFIVDNSSQKAGQNVNKLQSLTANVVPLSECSRGSWSKSSKFTYCLRVDDSEKAQHTRLLIQPKGRVLIGFLNEFSRTDSNSAPGYSVAFHHVMQFSQVIASITGLRLPNCYATFGES